ncbi:hypothetical protein Naga_100040g10 [Nannochloropsis gaditana]|uniref:Uncharacterized protein n=1 Tax=Nannochloropsis gaditana TaxID=72520 RepID=W7TCT7_9STRA|nr:hypothetical protein Naga_100040g10 [Nannochloropsis gaditana]
MILMPPPSENEGEPLTRYNAMMSRRCSAPFQSDHGAWQKAINKNNARAWTTCGHDTARGTWAVCMLACGFKYSTAGVTWKEISISSVRNSLKKEWGQRFRTR